MTIYRMNACQVACDHCGRTPCDLGAEYSWWLNADEASEAWTDDGGIAINGRHACHHPECGIAVLDSHPDLAARSAAGGVGRWWVVFDWKWKEYAIFYAAGQCEPVLINSDRSLATVMDEARAW